MKKQYLKTKLRLNSQTIRVLRACPPSKLGDVQGGRIPYSDACDEYTTDCPTNECPTYGCRGCG